MFQWPGIGLLFIQSVQFADIPVMAAYLMLIALLFVVINLVVDLLYFARRSAAARLGAARPGALSMATGAVLGCPRRSTATSGGASSRSPSTVVAAIVALLIVGAAFLSPLLAPHTPFDPATLNLSDGLKPPVGPRTATGPFPLGTDDQGRDMLSAIMYGTRMSLVVGFCLGRLRDAARRRARPARPAMSAARSTP